MDRPTSIVYPEMMTNLRGFFYPLLSFFRAPELTNIFTAVASLMVYAYCLVLWKNADGANGQLFDFQFSLAVVATILISYHLYTHDLIILTIPVILTANYVLAGSMLLSRNCKAFLAVAFMLYLPLVPFLLEVGGSFGSLAAPILIFFGLLTFEIRARRTANPLLSFCGSSAPTSAAFKP